MSAWLSPVAATLETVATMLLAGAPFFRWLAFRSLRSSRDADLSAQLSRHALLMLLVTLPLFFIAQVGKLLAQLAIIAGTTETQTPSAAIDWQLYLLDTQPGHVWLFRTILSALMLMILCGWLARAQRAPAGTAGQWLAILLAGVLLAASDAWSGHYAGNVDARFDLALHVTHITAVALWVGSLPLWWFTVRTKQGGAHLSEPLAGLLRNFSKAATFLVAVAVATGIALASTFINTQGDLLGTRWGLLLSAKLGVIALALLAANWVRLHLKAGTLSLQSAQRTVGAEIFLLCLVVMLAANLGLTTPASHDESTWWLPFRISYDAMAPDRDLVGLLFSAMTIAVAALLLATSSYRRKAHPSVTVFWLTISLMASAVAAWSAAVPAYPETFQRSDVPYVAESVAGGIGIYRENCVTCHGAGGHGDGVLAPFTKLPPADLSAPHTALHTAGDMFSWIGNGMPSGAMPGFSGKLTDQESWDLVNFLRVFSQGFQARVLNSHVVPEQAWLGAPDFYLTDAAGNLSQLKALRGDPVLLIVYERCTNGLLSRLDRLADWRRGSGESLSVVAVCEAPDRAHELIADVWFAQSADSVVSTYALLMRTLDNRGSRGELGVARKHAEFLIDRYGYIRARWIPEEDPSGWALPEKIAPEMAVLAEEKRIPLPPDDHIH